MKKSILILIGIFFILSILSIVVFAQSGANTGVSVTILEEPTIVLSNGAGETVYAALNDNGAALCEINWDGIFEEIIGTSDSYIYSDYGLKTVYYRCYAYLPPNEFNFVTVNDSILISEDIDGDGIPDEEDNCPNDYNPDQSDSDSQNGGDVCDVCPIDASDVCDTTESAATNINETGGTVIIDSGNAGVDIPAGALSTDTSISVSGGEEINETDIPAFQAQTGKEAVSLIYSFNPEGTTFDTPVEITLKYDDTGIDESTIDIYFYNSSTSQWEAQGAACDTDLNECTLSVDHFSSYIAGAGSVECYADIDCDDSDPYTEDVCNNPGTAESYCTHLSIACLIDDDCGTDGWVESLTCSNDDVWQDYITYTCNNPGTSAASCSDSTSPELKEDCGEDYCENWGGNYCKLDDVYHNKICHDKGCLDGGCFDDTYIEEEKVQECGISEYTGDNYCYDDDVYRDYITRGCSDSSCTESISKNKIEDCTNGCTEGRCKIEVCKTICNFGACYEYCVWQ